MPITYPHTFATKTIISGAELDQQFAVISNKLNANIVAGDINASAGIPLAALAASYERMYINFNMNSANFMSTVPAFVGWPAVGGILAISPMVGGAGTGSWTIKAGSWACTDVGAGTETFAIDYGYYDNAGAFVTAAPGAAGIVTGAINNAGGADRGGQGALVIVAGTLAFDAQPRLLRIRTTAPAGADNTFLSVTGSTLTITLELSRQIQST